VHARQQPARHNKRYIDIYRLSAEIVRPGVSMREIMEHSCSRGNHPATSAQRLYDEYVGKLKDGVRTVHRHLGDGRIIKLHHSPMEHGGWVITYEDVTERHKAEARVAHMAQHDALTDLPNRVLFREKMNEGLARVAADGTAMAVLCLDLDNFKTVNDRLGHAIGDRLLWLSCRPPARMRWRKRYDRAAGRGRIRGAARRTAAGIRRTSRAPSDRDHQPSAGVRQSARPFRRQHRHRRCPRRTGWRPSS
jgi:PAS fold/Diguanylate cyclase, GGDEF domain